MRLPGGRPTICAARTRRSSSCCAKRCANAAGCRQRSVRCAAAAGRAVPTSKPTRKVRPTMTLPDTLPGLAYLATYDRDRGRTVGQWSGHLLGAAAVADLYLDGYLVDDRGRARPVEGRSAPTSAVLADLWQRLTESRPRRWQHWANQRGVRAAVRDDLAGRWIRVDRAGGFLRFERVSLRDPQSVSRVGELVRGTLRGGTPVSRLPERDSMLVALLAVAEVGTVLPRRTRRDYRRRIDEMITRGGPPVDGLKRAIRQSQYVYVSGG